MPVTFTVYDHTQNLYLDTTTSPALSTYFSYDDATKGFTAN